MNVTHADLGTGSSSTDRRRASPRVVATRIGAVLFVWFVGWSLSGPAPKPTPGASLCRGVSEGTTEAYLTGFACPPRGFSETFGYEPVLVKTPAGWRFTRPAEADGRCNGPLGGLDDTMEFVTACQAHDYGYDLVRFGAGIRAEADELLYRDMMTLCFEREPLGGSACRCLAHWTKTVLQVGDVTGMDPDPLPVDDAAGEGSTQSGRRSSPRWIA